jgi:adenylyltransferase/sulfurtransferase
MTSVPEITPQEVKKMIDERKAFVLIDVREPREFKICSIPGSKLIPLGEIPKRMQELNSADEIVVHCRSGQRSAKAVELLMKAGFRRIHNMKGGILAWSEYVDPLMPKY